VPGGVPEGPPVSGGHAQSRLGSLVESMVNVVVGFGINFTMNLLILPLFFGHHISLSANFVMGLVFTVVSVARSYGIRRWFNGPLRSLINRVFPQ
jgi:hypothetical protein